MGRRWVSGGPCATVRIEWGLPSPPWGASSASGWWWGLGCPSGHGHVVTSRCFGRHGHVLGGPLPPGLVALPHCSEMHGWASGGVGTPYTHSAADFLLDSLLFVMPNQSCISFRTAEPDLVVLSEVKQVCNACGETALLGHPHCVLRPCSPTIGTIPVWDEE